MPVQSPPRPDASKPSRLRDAAKATTKTAARTTARRTAKKAAVHAGTKNPYVWLAALVAGFILFLALAPIFWIGSGNPNPLALQLAHGATAGGGGSADIPPVVHAAYVAAASRAAELHPQCALRPSIIAGIGYVESRHGTFGGAVADSEGNIAPPIIGIALNGSNGTLAISDTDGGAFDNDTVWDRAVGPMQFIPTSWAIYGRDANNDGLADPHNIFDAALAAVDHLCSASPTDMNASTEALRAAIFAYNRSTEYVDSVMERIAYYDIAFAGGGFSADVASLLANPNFSACDAAVRDLEAGEIDPRAVALMSAIVQTSTIYVCPLRTGHYQCVGGGSLAQRPDCTESHHWYGRAVDIGSVNGVAVSASNRDAHAIVEWLTTLPVGDPMRPNVGSPWPEFEALPGHFSDEDHLGHIHIGFCGPRWSRGIYTDSCP